MSDAESPTEEPEESGFPPPDADAPGAVDYPDPAFDDEDDQDESDIETPDDGEPADDDDSSDV